MKKKVIVELANGKLVGIHTDADIEVLVVDYDELEHAQHHDQSDFVVPVDSLDNLSTEVKEILDWSDGEEKE